MFGLFFGTVCLVLLVATLRRRHHYAGFGDSWHYHGGPPGFRFGGRGSWRGGHRREALQHLLARLDTTPGQEKVLRKAYETLRSSLKDSKQELVSARQDLAQAIGGDELDPQAIASMLAKQEAFVNRARIEVVQALNAVHEALDGSQRRILAEWIADGSLRDLRGRGWW
jgi:Spy/CpxP family protein refolding chaperone